jgi:hypothetical protein
MNKESEMGEVKRYYMMKSAVTPMADGAPCYTPLVNSKTDLHIVPLVLGSDYDALRAENERLKAVPMKYKRMEHNAKLQAEVDALRAEIAELVEANK